MLTRLKRNVQSLLVREAKMLQKFGVTPNQISALGLFSAFLAAAFYWAWKFNPYFLVLAPVFLLVSGVCDTLDGIVARLCDKTTVFGGFVDSLLDRYVDAMVIVAIMVSDLCDAFWGSAALVGSLLVSYARARAEAAGIGMETIGLAERAERITILSIASFISFFYLESLNWSMVVLAVLTNLTVLQRAIYFFRAAKQEEI